MKKLTLLLVLIQLGAFTCLAQNKEANAIKAGAARISITPAKESLPRNYLGINDSIYSRAIVIDNGKTRAALITVEVGALRDNNWTNVTQRLEKELKIPAKNVLLTATHTHSVPYSVGGTQLEQTIVETVKQAIGKLKPARIGYGTGISYVNVNRNIIDSKTRKWWEGPNYEGPSDKTVGVVSIEALDGTPIAVYYNYAMHGVLTGQLDMVSGDAPGATSRYIENSYDNKIVAIWSTGCEGDQNPIYFQQTFDLRDIRIKDYATWARISATPCLQEAWTDRTTRKWLVDERTKRNHQSHGCDAGRRGQTRHEEHRTHCDIGYYFRRSENSRLSRP